MDVRGDWHMIRFCRSMTTSNALGFFILGITMFFVPAILPDCFAVRALDGSSTSALWLGAMGLFEATMGMFYIARNEAVPFAVRLMTLRLPVFKPARQALPELLLRPLRESYLSASSDHDQRLAA
jgi:hypothetical protein